MAGSLHCTSVSSGLLTLPLRATALDREATEHGGACAVHTIARIEDLMAQRSSCAVKVLPTCLHSLSDRHKHMRYAEKR